MVWLGMKQLNLPWVAFWWQFFSAATVSITINFPFPQTSFKYLYVSLSPGDCDPPDPIPFAVLKTEEQRESYPVGTTLTYHCIPGYEYIRGLNPIIRCLRTSEWSESPQFCQSEYLCHVTFLLFSPPVKHGLKQLTIEL